MLDDSVLEQNLHNLIVDLCRVMYDHGYESMCVGAMMRMIGVGEERARKHDDEFIDLGNYFGQQISANKPVPRINQEGNTLH
jgi:hypothetical protein